MRFTQFLRSIGQCCSLVTTMVCALLSFSAAADDKSTPPGIVWDGAFAIGTELNEFALPKDVDRGKESPGSIRVGFSAKWSFTFHWERVDPKSSEEHFDSPDLSPDEVKLVELTNAERKESNLAALKPDPVLMQVARAHSAQMARLDEIGHELEGKTFRQRMEQVMYQAMKAGENIAKGQRTPADAVAGWMESPGHKANILDPDFTHIGVGLATSKSGETYWTQVFAKP